MKNLETVNVTEKTPIEIALQIDDNGMTSLRNLYEFLELSPSQFNRWCKKNVLEDPFATENVDYITLRLDVDSSVKGQNKVEYLLTSDFAKQLSMTVKNERGQEARQYFLACEQGLKIASKKLQSNNTNNIDNLTDAINSFTQSMNMFREETNSRLNKLEEIQIQLLTPSKPERKKPYNPWFNKMHPKYTLLEQHFNITRGQLYRNILLELENLYDINTTQIQADYCFEHNLDSCYPLEPYEYNPKYRNLIEEIVNDNLTKHGIVAENDPIASTRHITIFDTPINTMSTIEVETFTDEE